MRSTVLSRPEGSALILSPGRMTPEETMPAKPRKSWFGRLTHWTGMRNGFSRRSSSTGASSSQLISGGPEYQGELALGPVILSPRRADIGMAVKALIPI